MTAAFWKPLERPGWVAAILAPVVFASALVTRDLLFIGPSVLVYLGVLLVALLLSQSKGAKRRRVRRRLIKLKSSGTKLHRRKPRTESEYEAYGKDYSAWIEATAQVISETSPEDASAWRVTPLVTPKIIKDAWPGAHKLGTWQAEIFEYVNLLGGLIERYSDR